MVLFGLKIYWIIRSWRRRRKGIQNFEVFVVFCQTDALFSHFRETPKININLGWKIEWKQNMVRKKYSWVKTWLFSDLFLNKNEVSRLSIRAQWHVCYQHFGFGPSSQSEMNYRYLIDYHKKMEFMDFSAISPKQLELVQYRGI